MTMIKYSQIENLHKDHPLVIRFMKEEKDLEDAYASLPSGSFDKSEWNEEPEDYAGDRR